MGAAAGGALEDQRFSASSSYDEASVGPEEARYVFFMFLDHRGVNGGSAGWAIAHPVFGDIEVATRHQRRAVLLPSHPDLGSY